MPARNIFFAHSGGVTPVLNAIAAKIISTARNNPQKYDKIFAGKNGINGLIKQELFDTETLTNTEITKLSLTPASIFGSCRHKVSVTDLEIIFTNLKKFNIGHFIYIGGNDSQDTTNKIWEYSKTINYPLNCIGIPKTIDNDLPHTDTCPGYGSAAKYIATSILEASLDIKAMAYNSTKVFILEVMGRNSGWLAAAAGLAKQAPNQPPHIILFPEIIFNKDRFITKVKETVKTHGFCVIVASEGIKNQNNEIIQKTQNLDQFGHQQLGGVAPYLAKIIKTQTNLKTHWAVADYLQRSAGHILSSCDLNQALKLGNEAVNACNNNISGVMLTIQRESNQPYTWSIHNTCLSSVANVERKLPKNFISEDGWQLSKLGFNFIQPLIAGEVEIPFKNGIPDYLTNELNLVNTKITTHG